MPEPSGPGGRPARAMSRARCAVYPITRVSMTNCASASRMTRVAGVAALARQRDQPAHVEQSARTSGGRRTAFVRQARECDPPTLARLTDAVGVGDPRVVEEDLGEVGVAVHLAERPDVDAGAVEVEPERGDAAVLGHRRVVPGEEEPEPGVGPAARPHLLAVHAPLVAVTRRARRQAGEVGARARFGEELAPDLLPVRDLRQPARALVGPAVGDQRRPDELEADQVRVEIGNVELGELAPDDGDLFRAGRRVRRIPAATTAPRDRIPRGRADRRVRRRGRRSPRPAPTCARPRAAGPGGRSARPVPSPGSHPPGTSSRPASFTWSRSSARSGAFCTLPLAVRGSVSCSTSLSGSLKPRQPSFEEMAYGPRRAPAPHPVPR